jgi:hypothetical protein
MDPSKQPFRLTYKGKEYTVKYHHVQKPGIYKGEFSEMPMSGSTEAYIQLEDGTCIKEIAYCSAEDQFNKNKGRMVANGKLLKKIRNLDAQR